MSIDTRDPDVTVRLASPLTVSRPPIRGAGAPVAPRPSRWRRLASRVWKGRASVVLATVSSALVTVVTAVNLGGYPVRFVDEGTYVSQAWSVLTGRGLAPYTYWYDHPPLGWIQLAGWLGITGGLRHTSDTVASGRPFMVLATTVASLLVFVVARRLGASRLAATAAVLLFGLSPLAVDYHRMIFLDGIAVPWLLASMALALSPGRRLSAAVGSGACFAVCVLTKETFLLSAPMVAWMLLARYRGANRRYAVALGCGTAVLGMVCYPLYAALRNELLTGPGHVSLQSALAFQLLTRAGNGSPLAAHSPAHQLVAQWLSLDPYLLALGVVMLPVALASRRLRPLGVGLAIQLATMLRPGYLPNPFVIILLPLCALVGACGLDALGGRRSRAALRRLVERRRRPWRGGRGAGRAVAAMPALLVAVASVAGLLAVSPTWRSGDERAMSYDQDLPVAQAVSWMEANVPRTDPVLVDDSFWLDLVRAGWSPTRGVVWNVKLDLDPAVAARFPRGWRDFDYLVDTPQLAATAVTQPQTMAFLQHSHPVAVFGTGPAQVRVMAVSR